MHNDHDDGIMHRWWPWGSVAVVWLAVSATIAWYWLRGDSNGLTVVATVVAAIVPVVVPVVGWARRRTNATAGSDNDDAAWRGRFRLLDAQGRPPLVNEVDPLAVGVKRPISGAPGHAELPDYVARTVDEDLAWAIGQGGLVLLHGRAASGKSRTAFETVRRLCATRRLLVPVNAESLRDLLRTGYSLTNAVVWLDDLERFLVPGGLDLGVLDQLCPSGRSDVTVVATIRDEALARFKAASVADRESSEMSAFVLDPTAVELLTQIPARQQLAVGQYLTETERRDAQAAGAGGDSRVLEAVTRSDVGFAEYLAAGPAMMDRWSIGDGPLFQVGQALISAAVDVRRAGLARPADADLLHSLYELYLPPAWHNRADLPDVAAGLDWACRPVLGASSCVQPRANETYLASDYLFDRTESAIGPLAGRPIPTPVWQQVTAIAQPSEAFDIAQRAYLAGEHAIAEAAARRAADAGITRAMFNLGVLLAEQGRAEEAEKWWRQAAEAGYRNAMSNLGVLLADQGRVEEAEKWWRQAAEAGHITAMSNLGVLLQRQEQIEEAEQWLNQAAYTGHPDAMSNLAALHDEQGRVEDAEQLWRQAANAGHTTAMSNLGALSARSGRADEAERWYRQAADAHNPVAIINLAVLLAEQGRVEEAERWYRQAADTGNTVAMVNLGAMLEGNGQVDEAERWWRQAADAGNTAAMVNLGSLLSGQERVEEAERWWRQAADADNTAAMVNLGAMLHGKGQVEEAERWYRQAADAGYTPAMHNLGFLLGDQGRTEEAERWWRQAAEAGETNSMVNLGVLLHGKGQVEEAERWWRQAAETGDTDAIENLRVLRTGQGQPVQDNERGNQSAEPRPAAGS